MDMEIDKKLQQQNKDLNMKLNLYMKKIKIQNFNQIFFLRIENRNFEFVNNSLNDKTKYA